MNKQKNELEEELILNPQFSKRGGILPVVVQETSTGQILMLASITKLLKQNWRLFGVHHEIPFGQREKPREIC